MRHPSRERWPKAEEVKEPGGQESTLGCVLRVQGLQIKLLRRMRSPQGRVGT